MTTAIFECIIPLNVTSITQPIDIFNIQDLQKVYRGSSIRIYLDNFDFSEFENLSQTLNEIGVFENLSVESADDDYKSKFIALLDVIITHVPFTKVNFPYEVIMQYGTKWWYINNEETYLPFSDPVYLIFPQEISKQQLVDKLPENTSVNILDFHNLTKTQKTTIATAIYSVFHDQACLPIILTTISKSHKSLAQCKTSDEFKQVIKTEVQKKHLFKNRFIKLTEPTLKDILDLLRDNRFIVSNVFETFIKPNITKQSSINRGFIHYKNALAYSSSVSVHPKSITIKVQIPITIKIDKIDQQNYSLPSEIKATVFRDYKIADVSAGILVPELILIDSSDQDILYKAEFRYPFQDLLVLTNVYEKLSYYYKIKTYVKLLKKIISEKYTAEPIECDTFTFNQDQQTILKQKYGITEFEFDKFRCDIKQHVKNKTDSRTELYIDYIWNIRSIKISDNPRSERGKKLKQVYDDYISLDINTLDTLYTKYTDILHSIEPEIKYIQFLLNFTKTIPSEFEYMGRGIYQYQDMQLQFKN